MKPTAIHHLFPIAAWRQPKKKDAVLERIQTVTRELEAVQTEMHAQLAGAAAFKKATFLEDAAAAQVLGKLKTELDQLRRVLWCYIDEAAQKPAAILEQDQARRLDRVTGLLSALSPQSPTTSGGEQSGSFFERLNVVIDTYMQEKKPASAETNTGLPEQTKASS